jgi:hypothetical protein
MVCHFSAVCQVLCNTVDIDGGTASYNATAKLCAGKDPQAPGSYDKGLNYYNGGSFYYSFLAYLFPAPMVIS